MQKNPLPEKKKTMQNLACVNHIYCDPLFETLTLIFFAAILFPNYFAFLLNSF